MVTAVSLVAVVVLLALDVDAALSWVFAVAVTLLLWGPVIAAWSRGLWKSGKAFREGLDGR